MIHSYQTQRNTALNMTDKALYCQF